jgi:hypothetical protein
MYQARRTSDLVCQSFLGQTECVARFNKALYSSQPVRIDADWLLEMREFG